MRENDEHGTVTDNDCEREATIHALAVLGARVLEAYREQGPMCAGFTGIVERSGLAAARGDYASPLLEGVVAHLTEDQRPTLHTKEIASCVQPAATPDSLR